MAGEENGEAEAVYVAARAAAETRQMRGRQASAARRAAPRELYTVTASNDATSRQVIQGVAGVAGGCGMLVRHCATAQSRYVTAMAVKNQSCGVRVLLRRNATRREATVALLRQASCRERCYDAL